MNQRAAQAMVVFGRRFFELFYQDTADNVLRGLAEENIEFDADSTMHRKIARRQSYTVMSLHLAEQVQNMPEAVDAARVLRQEGILPTLTTGKGSTFADELLSVIIEYLQRASPRPFSKRILLRSYAKHEKSWLEGFVKEHFRFPLFGFHSEVNTITFCDELVLKPLSPSEKTSLWQRVYSHHSGLSAENLNRCRFQLYGKHQRPRKKRDAKLNELSSLAEVSQTALRILRPGFVAVMAAFLDTQSLPQDGLSGSALYITNTFGLPYGDMGIFMPDNQYHLTRAELRQLHALFRKLTDRTFQGQIKHLDFALRRFNQAYSRRNVEDRVIDFTITLESCLLFEMKDELKYRLGLRGATLISKIRDPNETKKYLNALYDARSKIVHNGKLLREIRKNDRICGVEATIADFLSKTEQITREVLTEYLKRIAPSKGIGQINEELDKSIIDRLSAGW